MSITRFSLASSEKKPQDVDEETSDVLERDSLPKELLQIWSPSLSYSQIYVYLYFKLLFF